MDAFGEAEILICDTASPCIGICRYGLNGDPETAHLCSGCARTSDEITAWPTLNIQEKHQIWADLPARRAKLGLKISRLPWDTDRLKAFIHDTITKPSGVWTMGVFGAIGEFIPVPGQKMTFNSTENKGLDFVTPDAALRFQIDNSVRALKVEHEDQGDDIIILCVKKKACTIAASGDVIQLGPDEAAMLEPRSDTSWFDLGINRKAARFSIRTDDPDLITSLQQAEGKPCSAWLSKAARLLFATRVIRIIETGCGRMEIAGPIPPPGAASPKGPHTHFLPAELARNIDIAPGLTIPPAYWPGAVFYPHRT